MPKAKLEGRLYTVFLSNGHYDENWIVRARTARDASKFAWAKHRATPALVKDERWYVSEGWEFSQRFQVMGLDRLDPTDDNDKDTIEQDGHRVKKVGQAYCYDSGT